VAATPIFVSIVDVYCIQLKGTSQSFLLLLILLMAATSLTCNLQLRKQESVKEKFSSIDCYVQTYPS